MSNQKMKEIDISLNFTITVPKHIVIGENTRVTTSEKGIHIHHEDGETIVDPNSVTVEEFGEYDDEDDE